MMRAKYHLLTGEPLRVQDAYALGMITKLVETPEEYGEAVEALARQIAALLPISFQSTKTMFNALLRACS